jgi:hypothetical protein
MKIFLAVAALLAMVSSASARNGNLQISHFPQSISDQSQGGAGRYIGQAGWGSRTIARNHNPNSIYDRWGNLRARSPDAFPLPRKHSYRGTVTLVR